MKKTHGTLQGSILRRIKGRGSDWAFTPGDLVDLGDPRSVGKVLPRLIQVGTLSLPKVPAPDMSVPW